MQPYPLSYFSSIFTAKDSFAKRKDSKIWQKLLTTFFLIALLVIPTSIQVANLKTYPLDTLLEGVYEPLTQEVMLDFQQAQIVGGQFLYSGKSHEKVYASETPQDVQGFSYQFTKEKLIIRKDKKNLAEISYQHLSTKDFADRASLTSAISQAWFRENRIPTSLLIMGISSLLLAANFIFLILGSTLILWLISKTKFFDFRNFGECYQFSLNCLGLPTLLACLFGLFQQPIQTVILVQNMLFALALVWVFYKTRFRDLD